MLRVIAFAKISHSACAIADACFGPSHHALYDVHQVGVGRIGHHSDVDHDIGGDGRRVAAVAPSDTLGWRLVAAAFVF